MKAARESRKRGQGAAPSWSACTCQPCGMSPTLWRAAIEKVWAGSSMPAQRKASSPTGRLQPAQGAGQRRSLRPPGPTTTQSESPRAHTALNLPKKNQISSLNFTSGIQISEPTAFLFLSVTQQAQPPCQLNALSTSPLPQPDQAPSSLLLPAAGANAGVVRYSVAVPNEGQQQSSSPCCAAPPGVLRASPAGASSELHQVRPVAGAQREAGAQVALEVLAAATGKKDSMPRGKKVRSPETKGARQQTHARQLLG